jgi:hypothetical protein
MSNFIQFFTPRAGAIRSCYRAEGFAEFYLDMNTLTEFDALKKSNKIVQANWQNLRFCPPG